MDRDTGADAEFDDFVAARWPRLVRAASSPTPTPRAVQEATSRATRRTTAGTA